MALLVGRARPPSSAALSSPLGSTLSRIRVRKEPSRFEANARRSLISVTEPSFRRSAFLRSDIPSRHGIAVQSLPSFVPTRSSVWRLGRSKARPLSSSSDATQPPVGEKKAEDSMVWTVVFSALVAGAIGFTVWQEVDGHETQSQQREQNRRRAEERERLEEEERAAAAAASKQQQEQ